MDFALETSSAGYERYVSESDDTDGEADTTSSARASGSGPAGGQYSRHQRGTGTSASLVAMGSNREKVVVTENGNASLGTSQDKEQHRQKSSIFSKIASSWRTGDNSKEGSVAAAQHEGDALWKDVQKGNPGVRDGGGAGGGGMGAAGDGRMGSMAQAMR